eukprot:gene5022-biopygen1638
MDHGVGQKAKTTVGLLIHGGSIGFELRSVEVNGHVCVIGVTRELFQYQIFPTHKSLVTHVLPACPDPRARNSRFWSIFQPTPKHVQLARKAGAEAILKGFGPSFDLVGNFGRFSFGDRRGSDTEEVISGTTICELDETTRGRFCQAFFSTMSGENYEVIVCRVLVALIPSVHVIHPLGLGDRYDGTRVHNPGCKNYCS